MPTIKKPNQHFDATLYTGSGGTTNITGMTFQPDFIWVKNRSNPVSHCWVDSNRGAPNQLASDLTAAENSGGNDRTLYGGISTILSNGFTAISGTDPTYKATNGSGQTYVAWYWKANQGTNTSNTSGSITSTVSVNTTAGFSIVTYTGTGSVATVGHGLGVAPRMVIVKSRSAGSTDWVVYHASLGATKNVRLQSTAVAATQTVMWNDTDPTSTVFTIGTNNNVNTNAQTQVAYCWAEVEGYSKFGSFTGNGSTDGPFVYLGFRPKFILYKNISNVSNWVIFDTSRSPYNNFSADIYANISDAEYSGGINPDILSNGFKIRTSNSTWNGNGNTFIYAAFAEAPFKYANAK